MDSFTLLHQALSQNYEVDCLTFDYDQRHIKEIKYAHLACEENKLSNLKIKIANVESIFAKSALTSNSIEMPHGSYQAETMQSTIVPNRNMLFISHAIAYAISKNINKVWYGAHAGDHFIYPDCRPEFLKSMDVAAGLCDPSQVSVKGPFINLNKGEIFKKGISLGIDYSKTWTCYEGQEFACGKCGSCVERLEAFADNKVTDPLNYK